MPELPEVETVGRGLAPVMIGQTIQTAIQQRDTLRWALPKNFAARLMGCKVLEIRRRSKYLLIALSSGETWLMHLGMSGRVSIHLHHDTPMETLPDRMARHDHIGLQFETGDQVIYHDPRRFGAMDLVASEQTESHAWLVKLGPEPLGNQFHAAYLHEALKGRKASIKALLLDQRLVAGLGNIYVCEALYHAQIDPRRSGGSLPLSALENLVVAVRRVLKAAIESGGSSLKDYRQADGNLGYFQHQFQVYGRGDQGCLRASCMANVTKITQSGRSTYFCTKCQS